MLFIAGLITLKSLLRSQLYSSQEWNENILDKRTADVSKLLTKLRSVSMTGHQGNSDWKLKHDLEDYRVMYREGLDGSPFHTMLVEGYMDAPIQECLCVSWESTLYKKWWPQFAFPPFKILQSTCLQKVRIGEQISDLDSIGVSSKEINENVMSVTPGAVRIDLVGGFVLQKVTTQRSYFRTIGDMDIKLDFVPPSLMNFITRQLIGNGFRLYKKAVASVAKFDDDHSRALADPLYTKIHQALYSTDKVVEKEPKLEVNGDSMQKNEHENEKDASENEHVNCGRAVPEIEEEEEDDDFEESFSSEEVNVNGKTHVDVRRQFCISPEVKQALGTLDRVIYMVRNTTPVHEAEELSTDRAEDDHAKQISLLEHFENVPQKSERQDFSTVTVTQETSVFSQDKREKETGEEENGILDKGGKNKNLGRRKRKTRCLAFRSWL
ncbi:hypothetical protein Bca101_012463 [Brassica carinata]